MINDLNLAIGCTLSCLKLNLKLKSKQVEAIRLVYEGKDAFVWLSTGCNFLSDVHFEDLEFFFVTQPFPHNACANYVVALG